MAVFCLADTTFPVFRKQNKGLISIATCLLLVHEFYSLWSNYPLDYTEDKLWSLNLYEVNMKTHIGPLVIFFLIAEKWFIFFLIRL